MNADYKNWIPKGMILGFAAGALFLAAVSGAIYILSEMSVIWILAEAVSCIGSAACAAVTLWLIIAYRRFSYNGKRQLSKQIIEGTAEYVTLPKGGVGLDVGCGSGALTIACARRNPSGTFIGMDRWGRDYASFSRRLCENNSKAEGVFNTTFKNGNALKIDFPDETFDAVTSNYVYHNITGSDRQALLRETLRVLKKGGTFAIHDLMPRSIYGDMEKFAADLRAQGYAEVRLIPTDSGKFMSKSEAFWMMLKGSALLVGRK